MKFETIVWIITFIAFLGFSIFRKMRASSTTGEKRSDKQSSGWKVKVEKLMSQIQQMAGDVDEREHPEQTPRDLSPKTARPAVEKPLIPEQIPDLPTTLAEGAETTALEKPVVPIYFDTSITDLRKAVVWSEILAPPLALRNKRPK